MSPGIAKKVCLNDCVLRPIYKFEIRRMNSVALLLSKKRLVRDDFILYRQNILYPMMYHIMLQQRFSFSKRIFIFSGEMFILQAKCQL